MEYISLQMFVAHILGDFYFQDDTSCNEKRDEKFFGRKKILHAIVIFIVSCALSFSWCGWCLALMIAITHWLIDAIKSLVEKKMNIKTKEDENSKTIKLKDSRYTLWPFIADQFLHIILIIVLCHLWTNCNNEVSEPIINFTQTHILYELGIVALLVAGKPSNIFITQVLKLFQVNIGKKNGKEDAADAKKEHSNFRSGALIGTLERCLMIFFVILSNYEAIGFLIAAKSILRFSETKDGSEKAEYVLAGTFLSVAISLALGFLVIHKCWIY